MGDSTAINSQFPTGFRVTAPTPVDVRLILTKDKMKRAHLDFAMPDEYFCLCIEDHRIYSYNKSNPEDPEIGRFILAEAELQAAFEAEVERSIAEDGRLAALIADEERRARAAESSLAEDLAAETARAEEAEAAEASRATVAEAQLQANITSEGLVRNAADVAINSRIDSIEARTDVVDVVGTKAALLSYDTSTLSDRDIVKVLVDESRDDKVSYYRWLAATSSWEYVGSVDGYYTKAEDNALLAAKQNTLVSGSNIKTINSQSLLGSGNIQLQLEIEPATDAEIDALFGI